MKRKLLVITICFFYTVGFAFLAVANVNPEGTGTAFFLIPLATWILVLAAFYLEINYMDSSKRTYVVVLLIIHYLSVVILSFIYHEELYKGESRLLRAWEINRTWVLAAVLFYLSGQLFLWLLFLLDRRHKEIR